MANTGATILTVINLCMGVFSAELQALNNCNMDQSQGEQVNSDENNGAEASGASLSLPGAGPHAAMVVDGEKEAQPVDGEKEAQPDVAVEISKSGRENDQGAAESVPKRQAVSPLNESPAPDGETLAAAQPVPAAQDSQTAPAGQTPAPAAHEPQLPKVILDFQEEIRAIDDSKTRGIFGAWVAAVSEREAYLCGYPGAVCNWLTWPVADL
jgi:hypothetical protein